MHSDFVHSDSDSDLQS